LQLMIIVLASKFYLLEEILWLERLMGWENWAREIACTVFLPSTLTLSSVLVCWTIDCVRSSVNSLFMCAFELEMKILK
jgi:hypothetical protein